MSATPCRKLPLLLSLTSLALIAAFSIACGNSSTPSCTGGPYDVVGDWTLSLGGTTGPGVIDTTGIAVFFQSTVTGTSSPQGTTITMPSITGTCSFSGNSTAYVPPNTTINGPHSGSVSVTGTVTSATAISGTVGTGSNSSSFSLSPNATLTGSPAALTTTLQGQLQGALTADILTVQIAPMAGGNPASMTLTGNDGGTQGSNCTVSGTFTQEGTSTANLNVFSTSITFAGNTCPTTGTLAGLGFESNTDYFNFTGATQLTGTYLYAIDSTGAATFELYPTGCASCSRKE